MEVADQLIEKIIRDQELIIGPIAWIEAKKVKGLEIREETVYLQGRARPVLEALVSRYARLFGDASIEVCKDAARPFIGKLPKTELPTSLQ